MKACKTLPETSVTDKHFQLGSEIKTQKSVSFLYTNYNQTEKEINETILFTIASKKSWDNSKQVKYLYNKNFNFNIHFVLPAIHAG